MKKKWIWLLLPAALLLLILLHVHSLARLAPSEIGRQVPVLMYHAVGDDCLGEEHLFVRPAELEQQLQYLSENGYETIFFEDLAHLERYEKPVILTFDDGYDDNYTLLLPLLPGAVCMLMSLIIEPVFREYTAEQGDENTDAWYNE